MTFTIDPALTIDNDPKMHALTERDRELNERRAVVEEKLSKVRSVDDQTGEFRYTENADYIQVAAAAMVVGGEVPKHYASAPDLERELAAIEKAIEIVGNSLMNQQRFAATRIRAQLVPMRRKLVDDMIGTARALRDTLLAEAAFSRQLAIRGIEPWGQPLNFGVLRIGKSLPEQIIHALGVYIGEEFDSGPMVGC